MQGRILRIRKYFRKISNVILNKPKSKRKRELDLRWNWIYASPLLFPHLEVFQIRLEHFYDETLNLDFLWGRNWGKMPLLRLRQLWIQNLCIITFLTWRKEFFHTRLTHFNILHRFLPFLEEKKEREILKSWKAKKSKITKVSVKGPKSRKWIKLKSTGLTNSGV